MEEKIKKRAKVIPIAPLIVSQDMIMSVVGIGRNTALELEKTGKFPKRRKIPNTNRVGWYLGDLRLWAEGLPFVGEKEDE